MITPEQFSQIQKEFDEQYLPEKSDDECFYFDLENGVKTISNDVLISRKRDSTKNLHHSSTLHNQAVRLMRKHKKEDGIKC